MGELRPRGLTDAGSAVADEHAPALPGAPDSTRPSPEVRRPPSEIRSFGQLLGSSGLRDGDLPERDRTPLRDLDL